MMAWMAGSLASYVILVISIRALSGSLGTYEIALIRNAGGIFVCLYLLRGHPNLRGALGSLPAAEHFGRAAVHAAGAIVMLWSVSHLPLALVSSLEFTGPLFAMAIAAALFKERVTPASAAAAGLILAGVGSILAVSPGGIALVLLAPLAATALLTTSNVMLKKMAETCPVPLILLAMNVIQIPIFLLGMILSGAHFQGLTPSGPTLAAIAGVILAGVGNQACLGNASKSGSAFQIAMIDTFRIPALALTGYALYGESVSTSTIAGAAVIAVGAIAITWSRSRAPKRAPRAERST